MKPTRISIAIEVHRHAETDTDPDKLYDHEFQKVYQSKTIIPTDGRTQDDVTTQAIAALEAAFVLGGVRFDPMIAPEDMAGELARRSAAIAGVEPDGVATTAGDVAAFLSGEDEPVRYEGMAVPEAVALTHSDAAPHVRIPGAETLG